MNTKERHKEQRQASRRTMGFSATIGLAVALGMITLSEASTMTTEWGFYLIAYGLGGVSVFVVWRLAGYELVCKRKKESE